MFPIHCVTVTVDKNSYLNAYHSFSPERNFSLNVTKPWIYYIRSSLTAYTQIWQAQKDGKIIKIYRALKKVSKEQLIRNILDNFMIWSIFAYFIFEQHHGTCSKVNKTCYS